MYIKIGFTLLWLTFISYAFFFAPPNQPDTIELIINLSTGKWEGINPLIISLFNLMGILPMVYACVLFIDGRGQKLWASPFAIGSFLVGAFAIIPYLIFRQPHQDFVGEKDWFINILESKITVFLITLVAIILLWFGLVNGNFTDFIQQWQSDRFIHVMSLDFCLLCLLFPSLLGDDLARRGVKNKLGYLAIAFIPVLGASLYLWLRPSLPSEQLTNQSIKE